MGTLKQLFFIAFRYLYLGVGVKPDIRFSVGGVDVMAAGNGFHKISVAALFNAEYLHIHRADSYIITAEVAVRYEHSDFGNISPPIFFKGAKLKFGVVAEHIIKSAFNISRKYGFCDTHTLLCRRFHHNAER